MSTLTFAEVDQLIRYDAETGKLWWKPRGPEYFSSLGHCKMWNKRFAGKEAFTANTGQGYRGGSVLSKHLLAHRLVWLLHYGEWPSSEIDHINGDRADNRIANLRCVTSAENARNRKRRSDNTSGYPGVRWSTTIKRYVAHIGIDGMLIRIGSFRRVEDAIEAKKLAEAKMGFGPNHGSHP